MIPDEPTPNPGTREAKKLGCICPVYDNNFGAGRGRDDEGKLIFVINGGCKLHGYRGSNECS